MRSRRPHGLGTLAEHPHGVVETTLVGERTGVDDAALRHELGTRRDGRELLPGLLDLAPAALGAVAVHEHRMLLDRIGQLHERLELLARRRGSFRAGTARRRRALVRWVPAGSDHVAAAECAARRVAVVRERVGGVHDPLDCGVGVTPRDPRHLVLHVAGSRPPAPPDGRRRRTGLRGVGTRRSPTTRTRGRPPARGARSAGSPRSLGASPPAPRRLSPDGRRPARPDRRPATAGPVAASRPGRSPRRSALPAAAAGAGPPRDARPPGTDRSPARRAPAQHVVAPRARPAGSAGLSRASTPVRGWTASSGAVAASPRVVSHHTLSVAGTRKRPRGSMTCARRGRLRKSGGDLLSQGASPQVPSALAGFTSVFGMGTGVSPPQLPPET